MCRFGIKANYQFSKLLCCIWDDFEKQGFEIIMIEKAEISVSLRRELNFCCFGKEEKQYFDDLGILLFLRKLWQRNKFELFKSFKILWSKSWNFNPAEARTKFAWFCVALKSKQKIKFDSFYAIKAIILINQIFSLS